MDIDSFLENVSATGLRFPPASDASVRAHAPESIDALFHFPLLALAVMVIARQTPFRTVALGRKVAMLLVEHFRGTATFASRTGDISHPADALRGCARLSRSREAGCCISGLAA